MRKQGVLEDEAAELPSFEAHGIGKPFNTFINQISTNLYNIASPKAKQATDCMKALRAMWAKNGDEISKQYAGTGSTSTEVTMNDKTSFTGKISHKLTSVERFFKNNVNTKDDNRQECIDLFVGNHKRSKSMVTHNIETTMIEAKDVYSEINTYSLCVFTWNLAGNEPRYEMDFTTAIKSDKFKVAPDVILIGFQETLKLNAMNILKGHDKSRCETLKSFAIEALDDIDHNFSYTAFAQSAMVGLLVIAFCKIDIVDRITDVQTTKVKTGLGGNAGNKGAVIARFNIDDTSVIVANCHLESGQNKEKERVQQWKDVITNAFIDNSTQYKFMDHDVKIVFGDLNFRISLGYESVLETIEDINSQASYGDTEYDMCVLLNNDQLNQLKLDYKWLYCFKEMPISFMPTYKYDKKSNEYDTSKKRRIPSWCDRILWYHNDTKSGTKDHELLQPILYERRETTFSDHRPVVAYFEMQTHHHNAARKESFKRKVVKRSATAHIVKKPHYDPEESKVDKNFDDFAAFDIPVNAPNDHIHLDLNIHLNDENKTSQNSHGMSSDGIDDLISMSKPVNPSSEDLIDIPKDDGNLINFSQPQPSRPPPNQPYFQTNSMPMPTHTSHAFGYSGVAQPTSAGMNYFGSQNLTGMSNAPQFVKPQPPKQTET